MCSIHFAWISHRNTYADRIVLDFLCSCVAPTYHSQEDVRMLEMARIRAAIFIQCGISHTQNTYTLAAYGWLRGKFLWEIWCGRYGNRLIKMISTHYILLYLLIRFALIKFNVRRPQSRTQTRLASLAHSSQRRSYKFARIWFSFHTLFHQTSATLREHRRTKQMMV